MKDLNTKLTIALKVVSLVTLTATLLVGGNLYDQYAHKGVSCSSHKRDMQFWLDKGKTKGVIRSIHQAKIQPTQGSTKCYGTFELLDGSYETWSGEAIELDNGEIIGRANVD